MGFSHPLPNSANARAHTHTHPSALPYLTYPLQLKRPYKSAKDGPTEQTGKMVSEKLYNALWAELALSRCSSISLCRRSDRTRAAEYRLPISAGDAPACLFPSKRLKFPLLRSKGGERGAGEQAQRSFSKSRAGIPPPPAPSAAPALCGEKEPGNRERDAEGGTNPNYWGRFGEHSPSSSQPEPAEPRSGTSIPAAAHCGALPARSLRTRARSLPLPQHRAVFLAALPLSPSCRALLLPLKRGDAGGWCSGERQAGAEEHPFPSEWPSHLPQERGKGRNFIP